VRFDLTASTDNAMLTIFDPVSLKDWIDVPWQKIEESEGLDDGLLDAAEKQGKLMTVSTGSDGTFVVRFYIEEDPPKELTAEALNSVTNALLRVPSGRLWAIGWEYLPQKEQQLQKIQDYKGGDFNSGQCHEIPAGDYLMDAYALISPEPATLCASSKMLGCIGAICIPLAVAIALITGAWGWLLIPTVFVLLAILCQFVFRKGVPERPQPSQPDALCVLKRLPEESDLASFQGKGLQCA